MARMTLEEIKARPSTIDWNRVNAATTDATLAVRPGKMAPIWSFRG